MVGIPFGSQCYNHCMKQGNYGGSRMEENPYEDGYKNGVYFAEYHFKLWQDTEGPQSLGQELNRRYEDSLKTVCRE